jgi:hypothetical protein
MAFSTAYDTRVHSILDFDYVMPVHSAFHPVFKNAAKRRLQASYPNYSRAIAQAFQNRASSRVWGILIEENGQPMCVVRNLGCHVSNQRFRRVLKVNLNAHYP